MRSEATSISDCVPGPASPTAEELISQLRSSFYSLEFEYVAKTLTEREERMKEQYLELKMKAEEEKDQLVLENVKLNDELKMKEKEIDGVMRLNDECVREFRVYEKRVFEYVEVKTKAEVEKDVLGLENVKLNDELKMKQNEIDALMKVNDDNEREFRVYQKRVLEHLELKMKAEEENLKLNDELKKKENEFDAMRKVNNEMESKIRVNEKRCLEYLGLKVKAEAVVNVNVTLNDELKKKENEIDAVMKLNGEMESKIRVYQKRSLESDAKESYRPPLFCEKKDLKEKTEAKLPEIIEIDDDDLKFISRTKRRLVSNEIKRKNDAESAKIFPVLEAIKLDYLCL